MTASATSPLILASTSRYRRELLERLQLKFDIEAPGVDETPVPGESPAATATRLARAKAEAVALRHPEAFVIGSDQVAELDGMSIGKPHSIERARQQLAQQSGREVVFHTALALAGPKPAAIACVTETVTVQFRVLDRAIIDAYLAKEDVLDVAGSAKCEGLGIALLARIESSDPTALIGLPLIRLTSLLVAAGYPILSQPARP